MAWCFIVRRPVPILPGSGSWCESDARSTPSSGDPHGSPQLSAVPFSECVFQEDESSGGVMVAFRNVELYLLDGSDKVWQILLASRFPGRREADLTLKL